MPETRRQIAEWLQRQLPGARLLGPGVVVVRREERRAELIAVPATAMPGAPGLLMQAPKRFPHKTVRMVMWQGKVRLQVLDRLDRKPPPRPAPPPEPRLRLDPPARPLGRPSPAAARPAEKPTPPAANPSPPAAPRPRWSRPTRFGRLQVQSRPGTEAIVMPLAPGLYVVTEVPAEATKEYGIAPFIPAMAMAVGKMFKPQQPAPAQPQVVVVAAPAQPGAPAAQPGAPVAQPAQPMLPGPVAAQPAAPAAARPRPWHRRTKAPLPEWVDEEVAGFAGFEVGCADCQGRCGRVR